MRLKGILDGPGWILCVVQHCEHAAGAWSTTTDLTFIRRLRTEPDSDNLPELATEHDNLLDG